MAQRLKLLQLEGAEKRAKEEHNVDERDVGHLTCNQLRPMLLCKLLVQPIKGNNPAQLQTFNDLEWPDDTQPWTGADEATPAELKNKEIAVADTSLEVERKQTANQVVANAATNSPGAFSRLRAAVESELPQESMEGEVTDLNSD